MLLVFAISFDEFVTTYFVIGNQSTMPMIINVVAGFILQRSPELWVSSPISFLRLDSLFRPALFLLVEHPHPCRHADHDSPQGLGARREESLETLL